MGNRSSDVGDVKALLQTRVESLVKELCPDGRRAGRYWLARCPWRDDQHAGSFWVMLARYPGAWRDEATGEKGDVLRLIEKAKGLGFADAMKWARDWLGIEQLTDTRIREARAHVQAMHGADEVRAAELLDRNRGRALAQWLKASEDLAGTPVATYLATRGIDLAALANPPSAIRFAPRRHIETGHTLPAMLALMVGPDPTGKREAMAYAVHCTFLKPDGSGKANVAPVRKMWPSYTGGAIRLARGETNRSPTEAKKLGLLDTLCLCEGVEDGLSIALACPELRVWAVGALGNLGKIRLPDCAGDVIVAADNDWGKPQAARLLETGVAALVAQGRKVSIARSFVGKDANDALLSGGLRMPTGASGRVDAATLGDAA